MIPHFLKEINKSHFEIFNLTSKDPLFNELADNFKKSFVDLNPLIINNEPRIHKKNNLDIFEELKNFKYEKIPSIVKGYDVFNDFKKFNLPDILEKSYDFSYITNDQMEEALGLLRRHGT